MAETQVGSSSPPGTLSRAREDDVTFSSGKEMTILGVTSNAARSPKVTFTTQSAEASGSMEGFWPCLEISMDVSSAHMVVFSLEDDGSVMK